MIPVHHIQRAIHAFYAEVTERALQLALHYPNSRILAEKTVRKSNEKLAYFIGILKSRDWNGQPPEDLQQLCREAEENSLLFLRELQQEEKKSGGRTKSSPTVKEP